MVKINEMVFSPEELEEGKLATLINFLCELKDYEIFITNDGECQIVQFCFCADKNFGDEGWKFVPEGYVIVPEKAVN